MMKKKKKKKRKIIIALVCVALAMAVIALSVVMAAFNYVKSEEGQKRINAVISEKLGPGVRFKRMVPAFFVRPHLVFHDVTIDMPNGTSGSMASIELYPKLLPLIAGKLQLSKLYAVAPGFTVRISGTSQQETAVTQTVPFSQVKKNVGSILESLRKVAPDLLIQVEDGRLSFRRGGSTLFGIKNLDGSLQLIPEGFALDIQGDSGSFGAFSAKGRFFIAGDVISANKVQVGILDTSLASTVTLESSTEGMKSADFSLDGSIGRATIRWISQFFELPPEQILRGPLALSNARFSWTADSKMSLSGTAAVEKGPSISVEAHSSPQEFRISRLVIKDTESQATASFLHTEKVLDLAFQGNLSGNTLNRLFEASSFKRGWVRGDVRAHIPLDRPRQSSLRGELEGSELLLTMGFTNPIKVDRFALQANGKTLTITKSAFSWADAYYQIEGKIHAVPEGIQADLDLSSESIKIDRIIENIQAELRERRVKANVSTRRYPPLTGNIRIHSQYASYGSFSSSPLRADLTLDEGGVQIAFTDATVCGISLPGTWIITSGAMELDFKPVAVSQQLAPTLACLTGSDNIQITGAFDLRGHLSTRGKSGELLHSLQGWGVFKAREGEIQRYPLLARIFSVLNVTELLRGKMPDLGQKTLPYHSAMIRGRLREGVFSVREAAIDGKTANVAAEGDVNIGEKKINITVLVAPFKTVDFIVSYIPLINIILGDTLISIPVKVEGTLADAEVTILSPTAIGQGLLGIMKRTLQLPFKVIEPILPRGGRVERRDKPL